MLNYLIMVDFPSWFTNGLPVYYNLLLALLVTCILLVIWGISPGLAQKMNPPGLGPPRTPSQDSSYPSAACPGRCQGEVPGMEQDDTGTLFGYDIAVIVQGTIKPSWLSGWKLSSNVRAPILRNAGSISDLQWMNQSSSIISWLLFLYCCHFAACQL